MCDEKLKINKEGWFCSHKKKKKTAEGKPHALFVITSCFWLTLGLESEDKPSLHSATHQQRHLGLIIELLSFFKDEIERMSVLSTLHGLSVRTT